MPGLSDFKALRHWVPAFAGTTNEHYVTLNIISVESHLRY